MTRLSTPTKRRVVNTNKTINSDLDLDNSLPISISAYGAKGQKKGQKANGRRSNSVY